MQDKILNGTLEQSDYDSDNIFEYLQLFRRENHYNTNQYKEITLEEWIKVVKQVKKTSTSSIFSKKTYTICKCSLAYKDFTKMLIQFYNLVLRQDYKLQRWTKIVEVILEKGKELLINKLQTIQLIEADF